MCASASATQSGKDLFYDIITLGLVTKLKNTKTVVSCNIENRIPCNRLTISAWEQNNGILLPQDLKEFYASTDGFFLTWKCQTEDYKEIRDPLTGCGEVKINSLTNVRRLRFGNQRKFDDHFLHYHYPKQREVSEKPNQLVAFTLSQHNDVGTICLVYCMNDCPNQSPTKKVTAASSIWLLDSANSWHFLANDFSSYFRMILVHLGLNQWQLKFTEMGLATSTQRVMTTLAPHLLQKESPDLNNDVPRNVINPNVFKSAGTSSKTKTKDKSDNSDIKKN